MKRKRQRPILLVIVGGISDLVLASKAMRSIHDGFPENEIVLLADGHVAPLAQNYRFVSRFVAAPLGEPDARSFSLGRVLLLSIQLSWMQYEKVVCLSRIRSGSEARKLGFLFRLLRARQKVGHDAHGFGKCVDIHVPQDSFSHQHIADAMEEIALMSGGISGSSSLEVAWSPRAEEHWAEWFEKVKQEIKGPIVCLHMGPARDNTRWSPDKFAAVAQQVGRKHNALMIVLGGPEEKSVADYVESKLHIKAFNLAGKLDLNELAYVISKVDLLITAAPAPMQIAAAAHVPQVVVFGASSAKLYHPYEFNETYVLLQKQDPETGKGSVDQVTAEEVVESAGRFLGGVVIT